MKIAFVSIVDPKDISGWSGTVYHMYHALEKSGHKMIPAGNLKYPFYFLLRIARKGILVLLGKHFPFRWEPWIHKSFARQIKRRLKGVEYDLIFSAVPLPIAELDVDCPVVFFADATIAGRIGYYEKCTDLLSHSIRMGNLAEQKALDRCSAVFYSSDWAAETAKKYYAVSDKKVHVVPLGANIECNRTADDIEHILAGKNWDVCRLLFVGVEWGRKGGDFAVEVARRMNDAGVPTELHIVGCDPDKSVPDFVRRHGFISKKTQEGKAQLDRLFEEAHFLFVPSRAECYGLVYCEASSFGLPSVATRTGGIPTIVKEGENGFLIELDSQPAACAERIIRLFSDKESYVALARKSFLRYESELNWDVSVAKINKQLSQLRIP